MLDCPIFLLDRLSVCEISSVSLLMPFLMMMMMQTKMMCVFCLLSNTLYNSCVFAWNTYSLLGHIFRSNPMAREKPPEGRVWWASPWETQPLQARTDSVAPVFGTHLLWLKRIVWSIL